MGGLDRTGTPLTIFQDLQLDKSKTTGITRVNHTLKIMTCGDRARSAGRGWFIPSISTDR